MYVSEGCGAVYVREKGELRRYVNADRNDAPQHRLFSRDFSFQLCIDTLPSASHTKRRDQSENPEKKIRVSLQYKAAQLFLTLIIIRNNPITEKGLGYLTCFKTLQKLDISGTNVTNMRMFLSETPLKEFEHSDCKTDGWAEQVINQWEITASEVPKKDYKPRTNALRFYGREKFVRETLNSCSGTSDTTKKDKVVPIHFYKVDLCGTSSTAEHDTLSSTVAAVQKGKKRRLSTEEDQSSAPLSKRQSLSALSAEDLDLLNSY
uniref:Leucine-rich repeat-containing protein 42-like n=1 Tax=Sinocyclocheilus anshuiensis TaxID=1608454 RepID=A0A671QJJ1_9TELE